MTNQYGQCYHPSGFIADELAARNWSVDMLIDAMMQHYDGEREKLEAILLMYFEVGPTDKRMRMGDTIAGLLHHVFGTSREFWRALERSWLDDPSQPFCPTPHPTGGEHD